jgi:putative transposase
MGQDVNINKLFHCVYALYYHLVICTKYRRKCIDADMLKRLRDIAALRCRGWRGELVEFNGEAVTAHPLRRHDSAYRTLSACGRSDSS